MMFRCVFSLARFLSAGLLLGFFRAYRSMIFIASIKLLSVGARRLPFFETRANKGTHLCRLALPDHQLGGKQGRQRDLSHYSMVDFRTYVGFSFVS